MRQFLILAIAVSFSVPAFAQKPVMSQSGYAVPLPPLPHLKAFKTVTADFPRGVSDKQVVTSDSEEEVMPGWFSVDCDSGDCNGTIEAPVIGTVTDSTTICYATVNADGWTIQLQAHAGLFGGCSTLENGAQYDVVKWQRKQNIRIEFLWGQSANGLDSWLASAPAGVELVKHGQKKPKLHFGILSMNGPHDVKSNGKTGMVFIDRCGVGFELGVPCDGSN